MTFRIIRCFLVLAVIVSLQACRGTIDTSRNVPGLTYDDARIEKKVLVVIYDPTIRSRGGQRLTKVLKWNDPDTLVDRYIRDVREASWNMVEYRVVDRERPDEFPRHTDGFRYDDSTYLRTWNTRTFREPGGDYPRIIADFDIVARVERHEIDEVWLFGAPGFGWYESLMAGEGAYYCNSDPLQGVACRRRFIIMGFNYERGVDCMLEDLGHRTESIMWHVYGAWEKVERNAWSKFTLYDKIAPGRGQCGNVHFAPNSDADYDWGNKRSVVSSCDDWYTYPVLPGNRRTVDSREWGGGDMRLHHLWWLRHLPRAAGMTGEKLNDWWKYVMNYDEYP